MGPIWYLDVDGVVNVVSGVQPHNVPDEHWCKVNVFNGRVGVPIRYDRRVVDFLNRVHAEGLVDIVWLSTWEERAMTELAPALGLEEFRTPIQSRRSLEGFPGLSNWWKWESVKAHVDLDHHDERAIIWTDDDLRDADVQPVCQAWIDSRKRVGLDTVLIAPRPHLGLTPEHLYVIDKVVRG